MRLLFVGWSGGLAVCMLATTWVGGAHAEGPGAAGAATSVQTCQPFDQKHRAWTDLLRRYVHDGLVDYAALKAGGTSDLHAYLASIEAVCAEHFDVWSRAQRLAFWINAYNAYTMNLIVEHHPVKSIRTIGPTPDAAFKNRFIPLKWLRNEPLSLDDIEHAILRREFQEPRVHFALVCAARSCPALRAEAYRAEDLDAQLNTAAQAFVQSEDKNRYDGRSHTLYLSRIFDWFREDFETTAPTLERFVARFAATETATAIRSQPPRIRFLKYDWALNNRFSALP